MDGGSWPAGHLILAYDAHAACLSLKYIQQQGMAQAGQGQEEDAVAGMREDGWTLPSAAVRVCGVIWRLASQVRRVGQNGRASRGFLC